MIRIKPELLEEFALCPACAGVGATSRLEKDPDTDELVEWVGRCGLCTGTGLMPKAKFCPTCRGKGFLLGDKIVPGFGLEKDNQKEETDGQG